MVPIFVSKITTGEEAMQEKEKRKRKEKIDISFFIETINLVIFFSLRINEIKSICLLLVSNSLKLPASIRKKNRCLYPSIGRRSPHRYERVLLRNFNNNHSIL